MGNDEVAGNGGEEGRAYGGEIGDGHGREQNSAGVLTEADDGRSDEAHDDERHEEEDDLTEDVAQGDHGIHDVMQGTLRVVAEIGSYEGTHDNADQKFDDKGKVSGLCGHGKPPSLKSTLLRC